MVSCLEKRQKLLTSWDNARWDIVEEENLLHYTLTVLTFHKPPHGGY
jgi:hypothetical protein